MSIAVQLLRPERMARGFLLVEQPRGEDEGEVDAGMVDGYDDGIGVPGWRPAS